MPAVSASASYSVGARARPNAAPSTDNALRRETFSLMSSSSASSPRSVWTRRRRRLSARAYSYKRNLLVGGRYWQSLCSGFFGSVGLGGISDEACLDGAGDFL